LDSDAQDLVILDTIDWFVGFAVGALDGFEVTATDRDSHALVVSFQLHNGSRLHCFLVVKDPQVGSVVSIDRSEHVSSISFQVQESSWLHFFLVNEEQFDLLPVID
jgi:hypothetical protein